MLNSKSKLIKTIGCLLCASGATTAQAAVYKAVTDDGRVIYTDNATTAYEASPNTKNMTILDNLTSINTPTAPPISDNRTTTTTTASRDTVNTNTPPFGESAPNPKASTPLSTTQVTLSQRGDYQLRIIDPPEKMAYRRGGQPIEVNVQLAPQLKSGDRLVYYINQQHIATTKSNGISIPTDDLMPGSYTLTVQIENIKGDVIATSERQFAMLPNNAATLRKKKAAAAAAAKKQAYDKLPWYKKVKLNITL